MQYFNYIFIVSFIMSRSIILHKSRFDKTHLLLFKADHRSVEEGFLLQSQYLSFPIFQGKRGNNNEASRMITRKHRCILLSLPIDRVVY